MERALYLPYSADQKSHAHGTKKPKSPAAEFKLIRSTIHALLRSHNSRKYSYAILLRLAREAQRRARIIRRSGAMNATTDWEPQSNTPKSQARAKRTCALPYQENTRRQDHAQKTRGPGPVSATRSRGPRHMHMPYMEPLSAQPREISLSLYSNFPSAPQQNQLPPRTLMETPCQKEEVYLGKMFEGFAHAAEGSRWAVYSVTMPEDAIQNSNDLGPTHVTEPQINMTEMNPLDEHPIKRQCTPSINSYPTFTESNHHTMNESMNECLTYDSAKTCADVSRTKRRGDDYNGHFRNVESSTSAYNKGYSMANGEPLVRSNSSGSSYDFEKAHPPALLIFEDDRMPYLISSTVDDYLTSVDYDEDIIFFDGGSALTAYKRVDKKVKPVPAVFPEDAKVTRTFPEDPLASLPPLPKNPPEFKPHGCLTHEGLEAIKVNESKFLWPEEEKLFVHVLQLNQDRFVFEDSQRGSFREDYFSPYIIPVVPHVPWDFKNIPIPPGIREKVVELLKEKIIAGVYEPSQSSYRSRWFCVLKKNGKLRLVHDLQPLNKVTIKEAGLPPNLDDFVEPFAGHQCYTVFDLYWGFDARKVHPQSRDLTAFQTPLGLLRITSLPTGFTNSPAEFQACMTFILQDEIPHKANIFIDDLPIKGPKTQYLDANGKPEVLPENPGIRRFIWEHALDVHRIIHRVGQAGGTFSPTKVQLAQQEVLIVGQKCTPEGRLPDDQKVEKILKWPPPSTPKEVRGFLGLCGTVRIWIRNYSTMARLLTELVRQDVEFEWNERREEAFQQLKEAVTTAPALRPIDYDSDKPVILSVDSSKIAVGFILSQIDEDGRKHPARYGSIPMNERESRYSQPKLELYGLFRALRAYRLYLVGVKNLQVEVDAKYIKGMLNEPDLQPNATINRWIQGILLFDFKLIHIPAEKHRGPDALSRREPLPEEYSDHDNDDDWLDEIALYGEIIAECPPNLLEGDKPVEVWVSQEKSDQVLEQIFHFLNTLQTPPTRNAQEKRRFIQKATRFFVQNGDMYKRNGTLPPQKVIRDANTRKAILEGAHEHLGHRGEYAVMKMLKQRFYWPSMWHDVHQHVHTCHECQIRSVAKAEVPLTISTPATIFAKIYLDVMYMPKAGSYKFIVAARDDLSGASEGRALTANTSKTVSQFIWEEVLCRYGAIGQVTTDNGPEVKAAFTELMDRHGIPHVKISAYNSKANGVVERGHFTIREAIMKACKGKISSWPEQVPRAFFADRVTIRKATGYSPFYLLYGVEPTLPFDLTEASFLVTFRQNMAPEDLLAARIRQLEKKPEDLEKAAATLEKSRLKSKAQFEKRFFTRLVKDSYEPGTLVLLRNSRIEKELNRKSKPRYLGPYEVVTRTQNGAYILKELSGAIGKTPIAAFRVIPYISRKSKAELKILAEQEKKKQRDRHRHHANSDDESDPEVGRFEDLR